MRKYTQEPCRGLIPCYNQGMKITTLLAALETLPPLGATDGKEKTRSVNIHLSNGWIYETYECEWEPKDSNGIPGDLRCFGKVKGFEEELGYFGLWEIHRHITDWVMINEGEQEASMWMQ